MQSIYKDIIESTTVHDQSWILTLIIVVPLLGVVAIMLPSRDRQGSAGPTALWFSFVTFLLTVVAVFAFYYRGPHDEYNTDKRYVLTHYVPWLQTGSVVNLNHVVYPTVDISYHVGVDGISIWLLVLASVLMPLAIWSSFSSIRERRREYYVLMLLLQTGLMGVFCALDLLLFYVFFEFTLVPLYFLVAIWGGPERRKAASKLFIFTLAGSMLTFAGVVYLGYLTWYNDGYVTLEFSRLVELGQRGYIPTNVQMWLFLAFAAGFAIKVPLFPLHTWLPLAHTEAPTAGSVILAGVLLKLGTYGFCRICIPILPDASIRLAPTIAVLAIIGIIYAALAAWVQKDVKKLVAYSSVSHLGFCMLGLFSLKIVGMTGGVLYMINHGLSTGALFLIVGCIYERYHTRDIHKIGGLARKMPWMAFFLVFFTLSSIGLPGLNGFVGEFMVLLGTATSQSTADRLVAGPLGYAYVIPAALGIILGAVYMLWMCQRVLFGPLTEPAHTPDTSTGLTQDLTRREKSILVPLALACVVIGVYPWPILKTFEIATRQNILLETTSGNVASLEAPPRAVDDDVTVASPAEGVGATRGAAQTEPVTSADPWVDDPPFRLVAMMTSVDTGVVPGTHPAVEGGRHEP